MGQRSCFHSLPGMQEWRTVFIKRGSVQQAKFFSQIIIRRFLSRENQAQAASCKQRQDFLWLGESCFPWHISLRAGLVKAVKMLSCQKFLPRRDPWIKTWWRFFHAVMFWLEWKHQSVRGHLFNRQTLSNNSLFLNFSDSLLLHGKTWRFFACVQKMVWNPDQ